jgi:hypothetical protein
VTLVKFNVVPSFLMPPPPLAAVLPLTVEFVSDNVPELLAMPPP